MLKFTTTTPIGCNSSVKEFFQTKTLISLKQKHKLKDAVLAGKEARIEGQALKLAGFHLPCFYEGNIEELDKKDPEIYMVLPSGKYPIKVKLNNNGIYLLDLKKQK